MVLFRDNPEFYQLFLESGFLFHHSKYSETVYTNISVNDLAGTQQKSIIKNTIRHTKKKLLNFSIVVHILCQN